MKITFIGTGYVGLVSGVMMSHLGHEVVCVDINAEKINKLKSGIVPLFEPGLDDYLKQGISSKRLKFEEGYTKSISDSRAVFITVGTPPTDKGEADLRYVYEAIDSIIHLLNNNSIIIIKSTVPPGSCEAIQAYIYDKGLNIEIISNPEFLREGAAIHDFMHPDRIVVGVKSSLALNLMYEIYEPLVNQGVILLNTDLNTAELIKYASNSFLANKIAFINEMANFCEIIGADVNKLSEGIGLDKRIGKDFLKVGPGFGGSCFPKDILALDHLARKLNTPSLIIEAVINSNSSRPAHIVKKISHFLGGMLQGKNLAVFGLTYKAYTDDLRSSPALEVISYLQDEKANVICYDPQGEIKLSQYTTSIKCADNPYFAVKNIDALIIATEWPEFKTLDYIKIKSLMQNPVIIDLRNLLESDKMFSLGYKYYCLGKKYDD